MASSNELTLRSSAFPAQTLLDSYYDRVVTQLSDRGLASNMIGDRWSDVAATSIEQWLHTSVGLPDGSIVDVTGMYRLDDVPQIASIASHRKLQNPDFVVAGERNGTHSVFAVDAKFSIETAKSAQVSAETLAALLEVGPLITDWLPGLRPDAAVLDGYFIAPDMPLTHYVLARSEGRLAARVPAPQTVLVPVQPVSFLKELEGSRLLGPLATLDGFRNEIRSNMLLAMYYFRLARACYGAWAETTRPIFGSETPVQDAHSDVEQRTVSMGRSAASSWEVVQRWDGMAEQVRRQREAAYAAMAFPLVNREIRDRILAASTVRNVVPPSINSVRKRLGLWYREQFDRQLGTVLPPVDDMSALLQRVHAIATDLQPQVQPALDEVLDDVLARQPQIVAGEAETA